MTVRSSSCSSIFDAVVLSRLFLRKECEEMELFFSLKSTWTNLVILKLFADLNLSFKCIFVIF